MSDPKPVIFYGDTPPAPPAAGTFVGERVVVRNNHRYVLRQIATGEPYVLQVVDHDDAPGYDNHWLLPVTEEGPVVPSEEEATATALTARAIRAAILS